MILNLLHSVSFWMIFSFVTFLVIVVKKAGPRIVSGLDRYIQTVSHAIASAETRQKEAEAVLKEQRQKMKNLPKECAAILQKAKESMRDANKRAEENYKALEKQRLTQVEDRLALMIAQSEKETQQFIVDTARMAVERYLAEDVSEKDSAEQTKAYLLEAKDILARRVA